MDQTNVSEKSTSRMLLHSLRYSLTAGIWVAAQVSTSWWGFELWRLSYERPTVRTMSVVIDDYAGIGIATAWIAVAAFAELIMFFSLVLYSGVLTGEMRRSINDSAPFSWYETMLFSVTINACVLLTVAGVSVAYAWTVSTLPAIGPATKAHSPYLANCSLQHIAFGSSIAFAATCISWVHGNQMQAQRMVYEALQEALLLPKPHMQEVLLVPNQQGASQETAAPAVWSRRAFAGRFRLD